MGSVENLISFNYSLNFFHRYRIVGVSVVSKGQDRFAGNILTEYFRVCHKRAGGEANGSKLFLWE